MAGGSLACIQSDNIGRRILGLPMWRRAAIHRMGKVVSCLTRAASASLPGSFFSRQLKSVSVHPKRAISSGPRCSLFANV